MRKLLLMMAIVGLMVGCEYKSGSGTLVKQTRNVEAFRGVSVGGGFDVEIRKGSPAKVEIEADDNLIDDIEVTVSNGQLKISVVDGVSFNDADMKVFITADELTKISSSASAKIVALDVLESDENISLKASSGSSIQATLNAPASTADASSGAEILVKGRTKSFEAESSSGASVKASDLLSENTSAKASSGATTDVHASVKLDASASSGGSITYRGEASAVKKESSGGSITKQN